MPIIPNSIKVKDTKGGDVSGALNIGISGHHLDFGMAQRKDSGFI